MEMQGNRLGGWLVFVTFAASATLGLTTACSANDRTSAPVGNTVAGASATPTVSSSATPTSSPQLAFVRLPDGFHIQLINRQVPGARFLAFAPNGDLLASEMRAGRVVAIKRGADAATPPLVIASGLELPNGLAFRGDDLYIATWTGVSVIRNYPSGRVQTLYAGMPRNADHNARAIAVAADGSLFVSSGSDCNVCTESDTRLATIMRIDAAGGRPAVEASGLRNASGLAFDSAGRLWATVNQRDDLTPDHRDLPVDELDAVHRGSNYGWPECYPDLSGRRRPNPEYAGASCGAFEPATFGFQAHSAPLQLAFYYGHRFPARYSGAAFVAFHGSWDRQPKTGYKIVAVMMSGGKPVAVEDFATGWLAADGQTVRGRPVGLAVAPDASLYVSDDQNGAVYRIVY